ncbi:MAG: hypothetical protein ABRQ35_03930 [Smithellaceae bacterium]
MLFYFTKTLALGCVADKIAVNCVCPGDIATPMFKQQLAIRMINGEIGGGVGIVVKYIYNVVEL